MCNTHGLSTWRNFWQVSHAVLRSCMRHEEYSHVKKLPYTCVVSLHIVLSTEIILRLRREHLLPDSDGADVTCLHSSVVVYTVYTTKSHLEAIAC